MSKKRSTATRRVESQKASERAAAIRREQERRERRRRSAAVTGAVVAVLVLVLGIGYVVQSNRDTSGKAATSPSGTVSGVGIPAGKASAPVKVIVYEDFMCPYCGQFEAAGRGAFAKDIAHGRVQFQYHILNFLDRSSTTNYSTRAANAFAVVMNESGSAVAKRFHDLLFENQPKEGSAGLSDGQLLDLAVRAGADRSAVKPGIDALAFEGWLGNVSDQASKAGVTGTPTVVVDGRTLTWRTTDGLVAKVRAAIDKGR